MSDVYDKRKVLSHSCPHCDAPAGERCKTPKGKETGEPHSARKGLAYPRFVAPTNKFRPRR